MPGESMFDCQIPFCAPLAATLIRTQRLLSIPPVESVATVVALLLLFFDQSESPLINLGLEMRLILIIKNLRFVLASIGWPALLAGLIILLFD